MKDDGSNDLVQVAVPRRHLIAVYGLLAQLEGNSDADTTAAVTPAAVDAVTEVTWSVEDLARFAATPTATSSTIGKVLDVLAEKPGTYFSTSELEEQTGVPRSNLRGAFAALTRHLNKHYGGRASMLTFKWGPELGAGYPAEGHYALSEDQSSRWKEARANA